MKALKRILLAEDDENDLDLTLTALGENNLANAVDVVRDGQEALDYLFRKGVYEHRRTQDPVVLLLDIKMPKVDGVEVLRQVRGDPAMRLLPVVVLTSSREEQDLIRCYQLGVNAYVVKPVAFDAFSQAVKELGVFWALVNEPPPRSPGGKPQEQAAR